MAKKRVYELAKELNVTSKRLIEKLTEIQIEVKNHMSLLKDGELTKLYNYIGVVKQDDRNSIVDDVKKVSPIKKEIPSESKEIDKKAPRIIRKTEIVINTEGENSSNDDKASNEKSRETGNKKEQSDKYVKVIPQSSGLRAGFTRDNKSDCSKTAKNEGHSVKKDDGKENINDDVLDNKVDESASKSVANEVAKDNGMENEKVVTKPINENNTPNKHVRPVKDNERGNMTVTNNQRNDKSVSNSSGYKKDNTSKPKSVDSSRREGDRSQGQRSTTNTNSNSSSNNRTGQNNSTSYSNNRTGQNKSFSGNNRPSNFADKNKSREGGYNSQSKNKNGIDNPKPEVLKARKQEATSPKRDAAKDNRSTPNNRNNTTNNNNSSSSSNNNNNSNSRNTPEKARDFKPNMGLIGGKKKVNEVMSDEFSLNDFQSDKRRKRKPNNNKRRRNNVVEKSNGYIPPRAVLKDITIGEILTVKELSEALKKTSSEIIKKLMALGVMATINQEVDFDTAVLIADEFGIKTHKQVVVNEEDILFDEEASSEELESRPPIVVVMGHVDHGKTSLLDAIREKNVFESEAGGITQHIGAYTVNINDQDITFLDTPGHEAFTAMRSRGASVTDIAILVVAADDGVMPQTIEAINHAKAANISIIVAINKMDKPGANPDKVKQELTEHGLVSEEWGGETICVPVSAKNNENLDTLLEMVLLSADMLELKSSKKQQSKGTVIEAKLDRDRGPVATMLVQRGTLKLGDSIVVGTCVGRIRAMNSDTGSKIEAAGPSMPVEVLGLAEVPDAGEVFYVIKDEKIAKQLVEKRKHKARVQQLGSNTKISLDDLFDRIKEGTVKDLNIIVKADVQGSVEAVKQSFEKLSNEDIRIKIIHGGVGAITESDVTLAEVSNAIIIGFNVRPNAQVVQLAKDAGVDLRLYRIIYKAIEDIKAAMNGMLEPIFEEVLLGHIEIRQIFKASGVGTIGGGYVTDGKVVRNCDIRIVRDGIVVHDGKLDTLKRFKDDVKEVSQGYECGVLIEKYNDIRAGDVVEGFTMKEIKVEKF